MALPSFNMRELLDAGVHFGHKTKRWNPRMAPFLYGVRNDVHIIDLQKTVPLLHQALLAIEQTVGKNGKVLFVGTKHQAQDVIAEAARRCGQFYINQRWLGGMLTNWNTIQRSIKTLRTLEEKLSGNTVGFTKKEVLSMERDKMKLERSLGGIKDMRGTPDLIVIIDTNKDDLAVKEAQCLNIPIVAVLDSNSAPDGIAYPVPGNDDSTRALKLYCRLFSDAALSGIQASLSASGVDVGDSDDPAALLRKLEGGEEPATEATPMAEEKEEKHARKGPVVMKKAESRAKAKEQAEAPVDAPAEAAGEEAPAKKAPAKKPAAKKKAS